MGKGFTAKISRRQFLKTSGKFLIYALGGTLLGQWLFRRDNLMAKEILLREAMIYDKFVNGDVQCRICFRELANQGMIPGVVKSSW